MYLLPGTVALFPTPNPTRYLYTLCQWFSESYRGIYLSNNFVTASSLYLYQATGPVGLSRFKLSSFQVCGQSPGIY